MNRDTLKTPLHPVAAMVLCGAVPADPALRTLLRQRAEAVLRAHTGAVAVHRQCPRCGQLGHGRPFLVGGRTALAVSMAYAGDIAVVAWGPGAAGTGMGAGSGVEVGAGTGMGIGIDVELAGPPVPGVGGRLGWTQREALAKATGASLELGGQALEIRPGAARWSVPGIALHTLDIPGYVATLACPAASPSPAGAGNPAGAVRAAPGGQAQWRLVTAAAGLVRGLDE